LGGKLEVIDDGEESNFPPPIPIEQQLAATKTKRMGKLEVIHDGVGDENNLPPPIPIEQSAAANSTIKGGNDITTDNPHIPKIAASREDQQVNRHLRIMETPHSVYAGHVDDTAESRTNNSVLPPSETRTRSRILPFLSSRQTLTNNDIEQPSPPEVVVDAAPSSDPPLPLLEATLVDDKVYDAVPVNDIPDDAVAIRPSWWKRHPKVAACGLFVSVAVVSLGAGVAGIVIANRERYRRDELNSETPSPPTTAVATTTPQSDKRFANRGELVSAIDRYLTTEDCPSNRDCDVGKEYGWPMKSWCVSNIQHPGYVRIVFRSNSV